MFFLRQEIHEWLEEWKIKFYISYIETGCAFYQCGTAGKRFKKDLRCYKVVWRCFNLCNWRAHQDTVKYFFSSFSSKWNICWNSFIHVCLCFSFLSIGRNLSKIKKTEIMWLTMCHKLYPRFDISSSFFLSKLTTKPQLPLSWNMLPLLSGHSTAAI